MGSTPSGYSTKQRVRVKAGRRVMHHPSARATPPPVGVVIEHHKDERPRSAIPKRNRSPPGGALVPQADPANPYSTSNGE